MVASPTVDHAALDSILAQTVRDERIDYVAVRDSHLTALTDYLNAAADIDVSALPEGEKLAYWFNLYNASMIAAVVERLAADWSPAAENYKVFKEKAVRIRGKTISLDEVEHEILRKTFKEPRLHVALVCGARSCPPLLARAYRSADLGAVLDANMRRFVTDPLRNKVDHKAKKLELSHIFDWFKDDFGGEVGVKKLIGQYLGQDVSKYAVTFSEYDWTLNLAQPKAGTVVAVTRGGAISSGPATDDVLAEVRAGQLLRAFASKDGMTEVTVPKQGDKRGYLPADALKKY